MSAQFICYKTKTIYEDLKCGTAQSPDSHYEDFRAGNGLFQNFKADLSVSINRRSQLANAHTEAPDKLGLSFVCLRNTKESS